MNNVMGSAKTERLSTPAVERCATLTILTGNDTFAVVIASVEHLKLGNNKVYNNQNLRRNLQSRLLCSERPAKQS